MKNVDYEFAKKILQEKITLITTASTKEFRPIQEKIVPLHGLNDILEFKKNKMKCIVGMLYRHPVLVIKTNQQGTTHPESIAYHLQSILEDFNIGLVCCFGICFSLCKGEGHRKGDVIISTNVTSYEVDPSKNLNIKSDFNINPNLKCCSESFSTHIGQIISGEKNINKASEISILKKRFPKCIGGDMETIGLASVCKNTTTPWITIKSISDFASGDKVKTDHNTKSYILNALSVFKNNIISLKDYPCNKTSTNYDDIFEIEKNIILKKYADLHIKELVQMEIPCRAQSGPFVYKDPSAKIHYEYYRSTRLKEYDTVFLLCGIDINISQTLSHFFSKNIPAKFLNILTPQVVSPTGNLNYRVDSIKRAYNNITSQSNQTHLHKPHKLELTVNFVEDYIAELTNIKNIAKKSHLPMPPAYINQPISCKKQPSLTVKDGNLQIVTQKFFPNTPSKHPIIAIIGEAGAGKSTFCKALANHANQHSDGNIIVIYLSHEDTYWPQISTHINTIDDLYSFFCKNIDIFPQSLDLRSFILNFYCGNITVIVDGIDEIHSAYADQFNIEKFINSILDLNNSFNRCKIIISARDYYLTNLQNHDEIIPCYLEGFSKEIVKNFFKKKCSETQNSSKKVNICMNKIANIFKKKTKYNPLIAELIAEIVSRDSFHKDNLTNASSNYLKREDLDSLIEELFTRESAKQSLQISLDEYLELLIGICIEFNGSITKKDFFDFIKTTCSNYAHSNESELDKFCKSPFLISSNGGSRLESKYKVIDNLLKARFLSFHLSDKTAFLSIRIYDRIFTDISGGASAILDYLKKDFRTDCCIEHLQKCFTRYSNELAQGRTNGEQKKLRSKISGLIHCAIQCSSTTTPQERTELISQICGTKINYFSLYGVSYSFDFTPLKLSHAHFLLEDQHFFDSVFPQTTVFFESQFTVNTKLTKTVPQHLFDPKCNIDNKIITASQRHKQKEKTILEKAAHDLKLIIKALKKGPAFVPISADKINQRNDFYTPLKKLLVILTKHEFLCKDTSQNPPLFSISPNFKFDASKYVSEQTMPNSIGILLKKIIK